LGPCAAARAALSWARAWFFLGWDLPPEDGLRVPVVSAITDANDLLQYKHVTVDT
jgi:hypothetical protein